MAGIVALFVAAALFSIMGCLLLGVGFEEFIQIVLGVVAVVVIVYGIAIVL